MPKNIAPEQLSAEQLYEQLTKAQEELAEKDRIINQYRNSGEGWLVTTPNPLYDGVTYGIKFAYGQAFIAKNGKYPLFAIKPMKATSLEKFPEAERVKIRQREKMTPAERVADAMEKEFGYNVEFFSFEQNEELRARMEARKDEFNQVYSAERARYDALMTPHMVS